MSGSFAKLIKTLKRETLEIKNTHRRSTLTVETVTKSISVNASTTASSAGYATLSQFPVVGVTFNTTDPQLIMVSFDDDGAASPFGISFATISTTQEGTYAIMIELFQGEGLTPGTAVNVNFNVNVTSTGDFTLQVLQNGIGS